jgi:hypothetical protein
LKEGFLDPDVALNFRDQLREARAVALKDAESFDQLVHVVERIGVYLTGRIGNLGEYSEPITKLACVSPLAIDIPVQLPEWHVRFTAQYDLVKQARNDALHEGAFARHLTRHAIELAIVLEDALMAEAFGARDFMVRDPVCALLWQPISSVRQTMLSNSFSFLPVAAEANIAPHWKLLSDFSLASYLRAASSRIERNNRLARRLGDAVNAGEITLVDAPICGPEDSVTTILKRSQSLPVLVVGPAADLRGIVTPFDVL